MIAPLYPASFPIPEGHYAPAVIHHGLVHVSGTLPLSSEFASAESSFEKQMEHLLRNCDLVLQAAGSSRAQVVSMTLYVTDIDAWDAANTALAEFFGAHRPARSVINVPAIRKGYRVQASLIAAL